MKKTKRSTRSIGDNDIFFRLACAAMDAASHPCADERQRDLKVLVEFRQALGEYLPIPEDSSTASRLYDGQYAAHTRALIQFMNNIQKHSLATAIEHLVESLMVCSVFCPNVYEELMWTLEIAPGWLFYRSRNKN